MHDVAAAARGGRQAGRLVQPLAAAVADRPVAHVDRIGELGPIALVATAATTATAAAVLVLALAGVGVAQLECGGAVGLGTAVEAVIVVVAAEVEVAAAGDGEHSGEEGRKSQACHGVQ